MGKRTQYQLSTASAKRIRDKLADTMRTEVRSIHYEDVLEALYSEECYSPEFNGIDQLILKLSYEEEVNDPQMAARIGIAAASEAARARQALERAAQGIAGMLDYFKPYRPKWEIDEEAEGK